MIKPCWNNAFVFWPEPPENDVAEEAILGHVDNGGSVILEQKENAIVLQIESIPEFVSLLKKLTAEKGKKIVSEFSELNLYQKLALMIRDAKAIPKRGYNSFHKYNYATHADVMEQTAELCGRYGVVVIQRPLTDTLEVIQRDTKNDGKTYITRIQFKYTVVNADKPEDIIESVQIGEGADTGDKGIYKASTGADKYFWFRLLQISTGDDPEDGKTGNEKDSGGKNRAAVDRKRQEQSDAGFISEAEKREVFKAANRYGFTHAQMIEYLMDAHTINSTDRLTKAVADDLVEFMRSIKEQEAKA